MVGSNGLEPSTSRLSGVRSNHLSYEPMMFHILGIETSLFLSSDMLFEFFNGLSDSVVYPLSRGGDEGVRTPDLLIKSQLLYLLSYTHASLNLMYLL